MALQAEHGLSADASVLYTTEELATALAKFETFHKLEPGQATAEQLQRSSAQIGGWLKASLPALEAKAAAAATSVQSAARRRAAIKVKRVLEAEKRRGKSIEAVHEQVHPALKIAPKTIELLHSHITSTLDKFVEDMTASKKEEGVTFEAVSEALWRLLPGELAKHAASEASKYYYEDHDKLQFNTDDTHFLLHSRIESGTVDLKAAAALTAIMEYLAAEILEVAGYEARQEAGGTQLLPHHVQTAIRRDVELASVFSPKEACEVAA